MLFAMRHGVEEMVGCVIVMIPHFEAWGCRVVNLHLMVSLFNVQRVPGEAAVRHGLEFTWFD